MKSAFGVGQKSNFKLDGDGNAISDEEDVDWKDPEFIKKKFGFSDWSKATKKQRIEYDNYVTEQKAKDPNYMTPEEEIWDLNSIYAQFLKTDSPLMIASGGAGVGKTYNLHLVAKALNKKPFDPDTDTPGDSDYDYVEAPEITSAPQLASLLKEHNGKTIVFDDTDNLLKTPETFGLLKKATASSGKRLVGKKWKNYIPYEYESISTYKR
jgi:DNA replication protein DnaC